MNYGELADFVRYNVHEERFDNYQAVMIKTLIQKNGRTTKSVFNSELQKTNPGYSEERDNSYVFDALLKAKIVEFDKGTESFVLLDHESFSEKEKTNLVKLCSADIKVLSDIKSAILDFQEWLKSDEGTSRIEGIKKERLEFPKFMKNLSTMDKQTIEFTDNVLYGLLPNAESDNAKRISTFGAKRFQNIKSRKKLRDYPEKEWNKVANKIYSFASKFEMDSEKLDELIEEFILDKYSNSLQTGTISPILFCINDKFPVINNPVRWTYNNLSNKLAWDNITINQKLDFYIDEK
ncbi:MAG: hypothetical protein OXC46_11570, partial [Thaumarchaeota archaeon]|nr:hypothetical protein [Nitrososphaerota archaeon]